MMQYEKYKESGIEWLSEIPEHWVITQAKRCCSKITDGAHTSPDDSSDDVPFLSVVNLFNNKFDFSNCLYTSEKDYVQLTKNGCNPSYNDVLYSKDGTIGETCLIDFNTKFVVGSSFIICTPNNKKIISSYYAYFLTSSFSKFQARVFVKGTGIPRVSIFNFSRINILLPPLTEQTQIAIYLDAKTQAIDKKLSLLFTKIDHYKELRKSIINDAVTKGLDKSVKLKDSGTDWIGKIPDHWDVKRVKSISNTIKGKNLDLSDFPFDKSFPYLSLEYLRNDSIAMPSYAYTSDKQQICDESDFVIIWDGAGVGEILRAKKGIVSSTTAKFSFKNNYSPKFFFHLRDNIEYTLKQIPTGMGIPHLNPQVLNNFMCPVPPLHEQTQIAAYLDQKTSTIDAIISNLQSTIANLKDLRKTLINDVVTGKIKVGA